MKRITPYITAFRAALEKNINTSIRLADCVNTKRAVMKSATLSSLVNPNVIDAERILGGEDDLELSQYFFNSAGASGSSTSGLDLPNMI